MPPDAQPLRAVARGRRRVRARVEGTVQGVGFRPFVHRLAGELELAGWVLQRRARRAARGRGRAGRGRRAARAAGRRRAAARRRRAASPPRSCPRPARRGFAIVESERHGAPSALVSPDTATCEDCLRELFDPADRRHRYPFINCTNCGPRFTIVRGVPVRPAAHDDGGLRACARPARPSTTTPATAASTPSRTPARRAARSCGCSARTVRRTRRPARRDRRGAARGSHRRGQGDRRIPPRVRGRRRGRGRRAARAQAPRGQAVRAHGARARGGPAAGDRWARPMLRCWPPASGRSCSLRVAPARRWRPRSRRAPRTSA